MAELQGRFAWTAHRLQEEHGLARAQAEERALACLRAELHNDVRFAPRQANERRCLVCDEAREPGQVLVPVLSPRAGEHLWLHLQECHEAHLEERARKVEQLLQAAGVSE